jgi:hypothetical protein
MFESWKNEPIPVESDYPIPIQYSILPEVIPSPDPRLKKKCFVNNIQAT